MTKKEIELIESLLNAIEAERTADYGDIDDSWANAKMTMSDSVYDAWNAKTCTVYIRAKELRKYLTSFTQAQKNSVKVLEALMNMQGTLDDVSVQLLDKVKEIAFSNGSAQERMVDIKDLFLNKI